MDAEYRNCSLAHETGNLKLMKIYSKSGCRDDDHEPSCHILFTDAFTTLFWIFKVFGLLA